jgi:hypothetical protein
MTPPRIRWAMFDPAGRYLGGFETAHWQRPEDAGQPSYPIYRTVRMEGLFDERIHGIDPFDPAGLRLFVDPVKLAAHQAGQMHQWIIDQLAQPEVAAAFALGDVTDEDRANLRAALAWKRAQD